MQAPSVPLLPGMGIFRVFSSALDLGKTAFLTIKTAQTGGMYRRGGCYRKISVFSGF